jgi:hypothetical protein
VLKHILHIKCFERWSQKKSEAELHEYVAQRGGQVGAFSLFAYPRQKVWFAESDRLLLSL